MATETPRPRRRQSGVTLTGLMVGLAVGTLVLSASLQTYLMISEGARDTLMNARLDQELRAALDLMRTDIRRAGYWDFLDLDQQGDANADGRFDWTDLGTDEQGAGNFDTNADGRTDALDLAPIHNPFQGRHGAINNDLCVDTAGATGDCAASVCTVHHASGDCLSHLQVGSCLTYGHDLDSDGRVGIRACDKNASEPDCPRPEAAPFAASNQEPYAWRAWYPPTAAKATRSIEMEMFGFRYRRGGIDMRVGRLGPDDVTFGCDTGRWERITSPDIEITELRFALTSVTRNANPDKSRTDPCQPEDLCQHIRSVTIDLAGRLVGEATSTRELSTSVAVRNDRYVLTPAPLAAPTP
nr:hypothetical protein [Thiocystis violacea]